MFAQESTYSKDFFLKQSCDELWVVKKVPKSYFQISMSKINGIFSKKEIKKSFKNINLGDNFL